MAEPRLAGMPHPAAAGLIGSALQLDARRSAAASARSETAPTWTKLLVIAALMPEDLNIRPAGLLLTMPRLLLLAAVPVIAIRLASRSASGFRATACDYVVVLTGLWMFFSVSMTGGIDRAVISASIVILEYCGTYFLVRTSLTRPGQCLALGRFLACAIAVEGALSLLDVLSQRHVLHDLAQSLTGYSKYWRPDFRNGIMRAQGSLEHPILMGAVCAFGSLLSLTLLKGSKRRLVFAGCMIGVVSAMSSAPIGAAALSWIMLLYRRMTPGSPGRWRLLIVSTLLFLAGLIAFHPRPFSFLMDHFTFDPQTGYYRLLIWNIVGEIVLANPVFGAGLASTFAEEFSVSNTVDTIWLESALCFGIPGSVLIGLSVLSACKSGAPRPGRADGDDTALGLALGIIAFLYIYLGFTVHFWGGAWILMAAFVGMRAQFGQAAAREASARE